ncbi:MAG TPA: hypothetical protein VMG12_40270, partial [Polyangiaceae bacterium]|nr:hypothetical protein [Polyangiaceae bacterium]
TPRMRAACNTVLLAWLGALCAGCADGDVPSAATELEPPLAPDVPDPSPAPPRELELHLLYVHGVQTCADAREHADGALDELRATVDAALPSRIADFDAQHPGFVLNVTSAHANLYTAAPSGFQPSDSPDPRAMDDWEAGDPGCEEAAPGDPCTTAFEWRYRLVQEIDHHFGQDARNVVLIGHSTGARAAFEVTANVGSDGVDSYDWGVQERILGVVSVHGMIDALGESDYQPTAPLDFEASCKFGDLITGFGSSCAHGNGWCEYAAQSSARDAADWVADNTHALVLSSFSSCSPSLFRGATDGPLPILAQASPHSTGLRLVPSTGQTLAAANGEDYGAYCHSAITTPSVAGHADAISAARERVLDWLFVSTQRVRATGSVELEPVGFEQSSAPLVIDGDCDAEASGSELDIVGVCRHPGLFDGDDHAIGEDEWLPAGDADCPSRLVWSQRHDPDGSHAARVVWKTYAPPEPGVVESLAL